MAIYINTNNPQHLVDSINISISNRDIVSWSVDRDFDYTIDRDKWRFKAWMRPTISNGMLVISIIQSRRYPLTYELYGVFHGRFVTTILAHFADQIDNIQISPCPDRRFDVIDGM